MRKIERDALMAAIYAQVPVILWGPPGIGKTATVYTIGETLGLPVEVVIASHHDPTDFNGLPAVEGGRTVHAIPEWAHRLASYGRGILFLDELSTAPPATQAAILRLVHERRIGGLYLGGISVVAAANPPSMAADGWDLAPPTANRFLHLDVKEPDLEEWSQGLLSRWSVRPSLPLPPREEEVDRMWPYWATRVVGFLHARPGLFLAMPKEASAQGRAWPSPRSWTNLVAALATASAMGLGEDAHYLLAYGAVGHAADEFWTWLKAADLPDPEELLKDPKAYKHPGRGDLVYATLLAIAQAVERKPSKARYEAAWDILEAAAQAGGPDVVLPAVQILVRVGERERYGYGKVRIFSHLVERIAAYTK